jgi:hypothetical protein
VPQNNIAAHYFQIGENELIIKTIMIDFLPPIFDVSF